LSGVRRDGEFAEYIAMPPSNVIRLDGIAPEIGAIMDPLGNAVHTVLEGGDVPGSAVFVLGCGPIGCFAVGVAPGDSGGARVRGRTGGDGAALVCEMSGHPAGHAQAFAAARRGGRVNLLGTPSRTTEGDFARDVIFKGLTLCGVTGRQMYETWIHMRRLIGAGLL